MSAVEVGFAKCRVVNKLDKGRNLDVFSSGSPRWPGSTKVVVFGHPESERDMGWHDNETDE